MSFVDTNYWFSTETEFYSLLQGLVESLDDEDKLAELLNQWCTELKDHAKKLFDQYALSSLNEDGDLKRVVKAREGKKGLVHYLNGSKALKALTG
jgi:CRISPR system Cascade subunit CasA